MMELLVMIEELGHEIFLLATLIIVLSFFIRKAKFNKFEKVVLDIGAIFLTIGYISKFILFFNK